MFSPNKVISLFRVGGLNEYLVSLEKMIMKSISNYNDYVLLKMDPDEKAENLVKDLQLFPPKLKKAETSTTIIKQKINGNQLPIGTYFIPGEKYEIETANYVVPYSGSSELFKYLPAKYSQGEVYAEINFENLIFKFTKYGQISGREDIIEILKNEFLHSIGIIESQLECVAEEIETFKPLLKARLLNVLHELKKGAAMKNDSSNKLNPFN